MQLTNVIVSVFYSCDHLEEFTDRLVNQSENNRASQLMSLCVTKYILLYKEFPPLTVNSLLNPRTLSIAFVKLIIRLTL